LHKLAINHDKRFWEVHGILSKGKGDFDPAFKELFFGMIHKDPDERFNFDHIRANKWFKKPSYSQDAIEYVMKYKLK